MVWLPLSCRDLPGICWCYSFCLCCPNSIARYGVLKKFTLVQEMPDKFQHDRLENQNSKQQDDMGFEKTSSCSFWTAGVETKR
jgi:hypothetical protein